MRDYAHFLSLLSQNVVQGQHCFYNFLIVYFFMSVKVFIFARLKSNLSERLIYLYIINDGTEKYIYV